MLTHPQPSPQRNGGSFLFALLHLDPYDFAEDVAAFYVGDDESNQQTAEEILLSTLTGTADEKLTQFALRLVLTGHTGTPRETDIDLLAQAAAVFEPPTPAVAKAKPTALARPKAAVVKRTAKKGAAKKKAA